MVATITIVVLCLIVWIGLHILARFRPISGGLEKLSHTGQVVSALVAIVMLALIIPSQCAVQPRPFVTIDSPQDNNRVGSSTSLTGRCGHIPAGKRIMVIGQPLGPDRNWYPQNPSLDASTRCINGAWRVPKIYPQHDANDSGKTFVYKAVLVDEATARLWVSLRQQSYAPLPESEWPADVIECECDEVSLVRA
jgi:hypothetical protein